MSCETSYQAGVLVGLAGGLILAFILGNGLRVLRKVLLFFRPLKRPVTTPGQSPFQMLLSCVGVVAIALTIAIVVLIVVMQRFGAG